MNFDDTLVLHWDREVSSRIHKQKLENIKNREFKSLNKSLRYQQHNRKTNVDRSVEISRKNKILYGKLLNISERKFPSPAFPKPPLSVSPRIPNLKFKKLEAERILKENLHLVSKLSSNSSDLSFKKMIKDYEIITEYRDMISKKNYQERITKAVKSQVKSSNISQVLSATPKSLKKSTPNSLGKSTPTTKKSHIAKTLLGKQESSIVRSSEGELPNELDVINEKTIE